MENTYFTCIGRGHGAPAVPATRSDWEKMRREPWLADMCARIEKGDDELKHRLPVWTPHCAEFRGNHRAAADALKPLNRLMMDFDEKGHTDEIVEKLRIKNLELRDVGIVPLLIEDSARRGTHVLVELPAGMDAETAQQLMKDVTGFEPDRQVKGVDRCIYMVPEDHTRYVSEKLFEPELPSSWETARPEGALATEGTQDRQGVEEIKTVPSNDKRGINESNQTTPSPSSLFEEGNTEGKFPQEFKGIAYSEIIAEYWRSTGGEPNTGERNKRLHKLAANLRAICDDNEEWLLEVMPRYGLGLQEMKSIIHSACKEPTKGSKLMDQIVATLTSPVSNEDDDEDAQTSNLKSQISKIKLPQGIRDSIDAVGPKLAMPVITAICPCIGTLATGVVLDVHGRKKGLNLISYIAGDFASGKGDIDPVVEAWMSEVQALDKMYQMQEDEWRAKKRAAKNKKDQPEEPKLPVRCLTLNNTVANLAERLANTEGRHAFSFTPEADTVAQKWKSSMSDFSVMLRQSYDGTRYDREARSADAVNVHIDKLLWNVTMCGTPDALYRVVNNYTDGFQSRIAIGRTPDNTFARLEDKPFVLTSRQTERIQQIAHLLPLMQGEVVLPKLEAKGREWVERIRIETMMNDDKVRARQRFRICVTAQRMTCCLMLCRVCEQLIQKHGLNGAEAHLKQNPLRWKELLLKAQTPQLLETYDVIADSLLENALYFFRDRIENAFASRDYAGYRGGDRLKRGKNDTIYERLDVQFTFEQAMQFSVAMKGATVTHNSVRQMLKNWRKQGLISQTPEGGYRKMS